MAFIQCTRDVCVIRPRVWREQWVLAGQEIDKTLDLSYIRVAGLHCGCIPAVVHPLNCRPCTMTHVVIRTRGIEGAIGCFHVILFVLFLQIHIFDLNVNKYEPLCIQSGTYICT